MMRQALREAIQAGQVCIRLIAAETKERSDLLDTQRKKGVLDVCVLSVLKRGPSYGYQIIQDVSACITVTDSTMYPILRRLEASGYVDTYSMAYNGRTRKYFKITESGIQKIADFLDEWEEMKQIYTFVGDNYHRESEEK